MKALNERYNYGLELFLLSIDEGITGYRDDSLEVGNPIPRVVPGSSWYRRLSSGINNSTTSL